MTIHKWCITLIIFNTFASKLLEYFFLIKIYFYDYEKMLSKNKYFDKNTKKIIEHVNKLKGF